MLSAAQSLLGQNDPELSIGMYNGSTDPGTETDPNGKRTETEPMGMPVYTLSTDQLGVHASGGLCHYDRRSYGSSFGIFSMPLALIQTSGEYEEAGSEIFGDYANVPNCCAISIGATRAFNRYV